MPSPSPGTLSLSEPDFLSPSGNSLSQGSQGLEVYSHPSHGVDPEQFEYLLRNQDIKACVLVPTHHYPTGISYS
jgi:DNA-binding transcriptional MocR family regulator